MQKPERKWHFMPDRASGQFWERRYSASVKYERAQKRTDAAAAFRQIKGAPPPSL